jgi:hypothetical protein
VFRCVLRSEGCVLVPRSSGTPVATWAWPIWVVSRRCVLEAVFILLEFPSPSKRIFIDSHSLPPLWFAVLVLQVFRKVHRSRGTWLKCYRRENLDDTQSLLCAKELTLSPHNSQELFRKEVLKVYEMGSWTRQDKVLQLEILK